MSEIKNQIVSDMKDAMRSKDKHRLSVLRMVKSTLMNKEIDKGEVLTDDEVTKTLTTLVKQRRDSASQFRDADRPELAEKEESEIEFIDVYLPAEATEEEITKAVDDAIESTGAESMKDMGGVMKAALANLSGKTADGKIVSGVVRTKLG